MRSIIMKSVRRALALASFLVVGGAAVAQDDAPPPNKQTKILDLVFRVEDLGGKVQDIQVKETGSEIRIELAADVLFDFDKADILPRAQNALKQAASVINEKAKRTVRIEGHTDAKGADAYNQKLSERRAAAVKAWLVGKEHVQKVTFVTRGFGAKNPVAPNANEDGSDNPNGRQKNRRVEIIITK
jgi:outer membrane protein OmpA-like peptidoglycan-associated protein